MKYRAISAVFLLATVQAISYAVPAGQAAPVVAVTGDPTGLVGKTVTPLALPKDSNSNKTAYGNDYFDCGGSMLDGVGPQIGVTRLRKGAKITCQATMGKQIIALTRSSNQNKSHEFLDVMEINVPKGYEFATWGCTGAKMAVSKNDRYATHSTKLVQAWDVVNFKFVPVTNLKAVKCENPSYGL